MLTTYKALLRGNKLEWEEEVPDKLLTEEQLPVHVTILINQVKQATDTTQGQQMAAALEKLANWDTKIIDDPVTWERDQRQERDLPLRS